MHGREAQLVAQASTESVARLTGEPIRWGRLIWRNIVAVGLIAGLWFAVETGYFSNDRTPRALWSEMDKLKSKGTGRAVYETTFRSEKLGDRSQPNGYWDFYNGATSTTAAIIGGGLEIKYTSPWIGAFFMHTAYQPGSVYRVRFEAKVEGQSGAILMRNRQLDHMREEIPQTNGEYKEFTVYYATPGGSRDQVRVVFIPNERSKVQGRMTIRKFRIEKMEG